MKTFVSAAVLVALSLAFANASMAAGPRFPKDKFWGHSGTHTSTSFALTDTAAKKAPAKKK